jgi:hypothetical protein
MLETHGYRARPGPEADHRGHLDYAHVGPGHHDPPDPGALPIGDRAAEQADLRADMFGRRAGELLGRPVAREDLHEHLGELPAPRGAWPRFLIQMSGPGPARHRARGLACQRTRGLVRCRGPGRRVCLRIGRPVVPGHGGRGRPNWRAVGSCVRRRRAGAAMGLAVVRRPAIGHRDEPQPGPSRLFGRAILTERPSRPSRPGRTSYSERPGHLGRAGHASPTRRPGRARRLARCGCGGRGVLTWVSQDVRRAGPRGHALLPVRRIRTTTNAPRRRVRIRLRLRPVVPPATDILTSGLVTRPFTN